MPMAKAIAWRYWLNGCRRLNAEICYKDEIGRICYGYKGLKDLYLWHYYFKNGRKDYDLLEKKAPSNIHSDFIVNNQKHGDNIVNNIYDHDKSLPLVVGIERYNCF